MPYIIMFQYLKGAYKEGDSPFYKELHGKGEG